VAVLLYLGAPLGNYAQTPSELVTFVFWKRPYLFKSSIDSHSKDGVNVEDVAMFPNEGECRKFLRGEADDLQSQVAQARAKDPKISAPTIDSRCIPETDPTVDKEWRSPVRRLGQWRQFDHVYSVYYYHDPEALTLAGATFWRSVVKNRCGPKSQKSSSTSEAATRRFREVKTIGGKT
jgi:hypothetical protein